VPLSETRRAPPQVHSYVEDLSRDDTHQFPLRMAHLVMQSANNISRRKRLIVLHEPFSNSEISHDFFVIALQKEAAGVSEDFGFENQDTGKWGLGSLHESGLIELKNITAVALV
jgi:hypothetical protein